MIQSTIDSVLIVTSRFMADEPVQITDEVLFQDQAQATTYYEDQRYIVWERRAGEPHDGPRECVEAWQPAYDAQGQPLFKRVYL